MVLRCPTGALHYENRGEGPAEPVPGHNSVRTVPDGPLHVAGDLTIRLEDGEILRENRAALCRCGASRNKPYCDGTHKRTGFRG